MLLNLSLQKVYIFELKRQIKYMHNILMTYCHRNPKILEPIF